MRKIFYKDMNMFFYVYIKKIIKYFFKMVDMVRMKGNFGIWLCSDRGLYFWNMCLYVIYLCFG